MQVDELLFYLFDGQQHILAPSIETWLASSRHFTTFVTTFRDKIRKKLRTTQAEETLQDLRLELETAYLLLQEPDFHLVYEPQCGQSRCPDFAASFTTRLTFMVEITRTRTSKKGNTAESDSSLSAEADSLADTICSKLGQLLPQHSNVLIVGVESLRLAQGDLQAAMLRVQQRVERNDSTFWQRYRFRDRSEFFRHYQRLSEVLVREAPLRPEPPFLAWINPQGKYPLPAKVRTSLYRSHTV
jgi:hypothetical protein